MSEGAKVINLRPADDIIRMFKQLTKQIEDGEIKAEEVICLIRGGNSTLDMWAWGNYRGEIMTIGMLEAAKKLIKIKEQVDE